MTSNPILKEIYDARESILAEYAGDTRAYLKDAQERLVESGRPIAEIRQRTLRTPILPKSAEPLIQAESPQQTEQ